METYGNYRSDEWRADERIRQAAPDLLAACKQAVRIIRGRASYAVIREEIEAAEVMEAAIAKAEGKSE